MSYLRPSDALKYVDSDSKDYVYETNDANYKPYIEDHGGISNEGLVELCCRAIDSYYDRKPIKKYLMKKLAERLNVKLRDRPLTDEELFEEFCKRLNLP